MVAEILKSYLVSLGVQVDQPGFNQMKTTLDQTSNTVTHATGGWAKNFVSASTIIMTAVASITTAVTGLMVGAAKQDLAMEKYARGMMVSKNAAKEMKLAVDALGESVQDIQITPELMNRYRALISDGRNMKVGGDYEGTMKNFRDLIFEFTRLKQEASYALQWVGYYLMKYLARPLAQAKATFKSFNDSLIKNMPNWTEKIARALTYIINIGIHFVQLLKNIGKAAYDLWGSFPKGVKIAIASLAALFYFINASPIGRFITMIGTMLLLIDDYFGYMEGKQAAMGPIWDKLNGYMGIAKQKLEEWGQALSPVWDKFAGYLDTGQQGVKNLAGKMSTWIDEIQQSNALSDFVATTKELGRAFYDLGSGTIDIVSSACKDLFKSLEKQGIAEKFAGLIERLWNGFLSLERWIARCIEVVARWFKEIAKSEEMEDFIDAVVELFGAVLDLFNALMDLITVAFGGFFGEMNKTEKVYSFRDAVKAVVGIISSFIRLLSDLIGLLAKFFKMMSNSKMFKEFWQDLAKQVKIFADVVFYALGAVGKLGRALIELVRGNYKKAASLAGDALGFGKAEAGGRRGNGSIIDDLSEAEKAAEPYIQEASKMYDLDPNLLRALIKRESGFNPTIESDAGAYGYTQLMPGTAEGLGVNMYNPHENVLGGAKYLRQQLDSFNGDVEKALAAYNAGPGAVQKYGGIPPYEETQNYVKNIMADWNDYQARSKSVGNPDPKDDFTNKDGEPSQYSLENPPDNMKDPNTGWLDRQIMEIKDLWHKASGVSTTTDAPQASLLSLYRGGASYLQNGFANADPVLLGGLSGQNLARYGQNYGGITIYNSVDVGGVEVTNTNASPSDIGNAVASKTTSKLSDSANYVLQNRALTGIQV